MKETTENALLYFVSANCVTGYLSVGALQFLWGLMHGVQMIALTSLFNVDFPQNVREIVQTLWSLISFDILKLESRLSTVFDFKETEAFHTTYDADGEA